MKVRLCFFICSLAANQCNFMTEYPLQIGLELRQAERKPESQACLLHGAKRFSEKWLSGPDACLIYIPRKEHASDTLLLCREIEAHVSEPFWYIHVSYKAPKEPKACDFTWDRARLFDHPAATMLYEICVENPMATVLKVCGSAPVPSLPQHRHPCHLKILHSWRNGLVESNAGNDAFLITSSSSPLGDRLEHVLAVQ